VICSANGEPRVKMGTNVGQDAGSTHIVLFDGVCNLCNGSVSFIIARDPAARFRFMPLQSKGAGALLADHVLKDGFPNSVALIEHETLYTRSTAALRIVRRLRFPWPLLYALIVVPRGVRDTVYDKIAHHRYAWFGKRESCMLPTPELRSRFLP
jgi:predicted DCC family thiol-disulfide oxidoreductase YuxK